VTEVNAASRSKAVSQTHTVSNIGVILSVYLQ
jgi:hypothetical protein